jgi:hypothetical protein
MNVIELGEIGRGREGKIIPFHAYKEEKYIDVGETKTGNPKIISSNKDDYKWLGVLSGAGRYSRGTTGDVYCSPKDLTRIEIVAMGYGAFGGAGNIGTFYEYLAIVPDCTWVKIVPAGGSKISNYWKYFDHDAVYPVEIEEIDAFCEKMDIEPPADENLGSLSRIERKKIKKEGGRIALLNSPIITGQMGLFKTSFANNEEIKKDLKSGKEIISAIGHKSTADFISKILDTEIKENRIKYKQEEGDIVYAFRLRERPPEGMILSEMQMWQIKYDWIKIERI